MTTETIASASQIRHPFRVGLPRLDEINFPPVPVSDLRLFGLTFVSGFVAISGFLL